MSFVADSWQNLQNSLNSFFGTQNSEIGWEGRGSVEWYLFVFVFWNTRERNDFDNIGHVKQFHQDEAPLTEKELGKVATKLSAVSFPDIATTVLGFTQIELDNLKTPGMTNHTFTRRVLVQWKNNNREDPRQVV